MLFYLTGNGMGIRALLDSYLLRPRGHSISPRETKVTPRIDYQAGKDERKLGNFTDQKYIQTLIACFYRSADTSSFTRGKAHTHH